MSSEGGNFGEIYAKIVNDLKLNLNMIDMVRGGETSLNRGSYPVTVEV